MRGFAAAKRDAGPGIVRNLLHIYGLMLIAGILIGGGALTVMLTIVGLTSVGDWLLGRMVVTNFVFMIIFPALLIASFLWLLWHLYWRSKSDSRGT